MRIADAAETIKRLDRKGQAVFTRADLRLLFPERSAGNFTADLTRLVRHGVLQRAARGVYVNPDTGNGLDGVEAIALALRPGKASYVSLATAAGAYSLISQLTWSITVMTTGCKGRFSTPWGGIGFTHTSRTPEEIQAVTVDLGHPLRWAKPRTVLEDLRRTRRHWELVDLEVLEEVEEEMGLPPPSEVEERQLAFWRSLPWVNATCVRWG